MIVSFQRLSEAARAPQRANEHDAGWDLRAAEAATIAPGERASVGTGIAVAIPEGTRAWCCRAPALPPATGSRW